MNLYLGIDFGTTGARSTIIDSQGTIHCETEYTFANDRQSELPSVWQNALSAVIEQIPPAIRNQVRAIALDGTSSTVMLCDTDGISVCEPILYNDARGAAVTETLRAIAPDNHTVLSATSSLAKLLWWQEGGLEAHPTTQFNLCGTGILPVVEKLYFLHQADWLAFLLHGKLGISDYHNALKLGFDVDTLCYPDWLIQGIAGAATPKLPQVVAPGTPVGEVKDEVRSRFGFPRHCTVCAGTTDSIAAFLASGVNSPGEAVTSLGSTLAVKLLSHTRVDDSRYGIYSHKLGDLWLVGGASNTGGAVLRHFFTDAELADCSTQINPEQESLLDYYPLLKKGDRFPINDPNLAPRLEPRPADSVEFLHGLLESIARIEARGYQLLQELGATPLTKVYTAGGGAKNPVWSAIRKRYLKVPVETPVQTAAAYGVALLAMRSAIDFRLKD
ncbi:FGGY-family carbohydrate kinase [Tychonema sp. LEGE 07199]|uniref:FGGY-family carbohydrate kinase n=1 Tax=unclassified Tychonema TaxID=2642144 RepID=UPI00187F093B|nr:MULTISPECIES: FGGY-family carbohydrate kinase [unclassified Tychonema]MBE9119936.1 FGGY-family carbohydrate kinase [Tychonema sp. LEGE 07199]MBE9130794.1 FGGY-family carbohydrate kinase [Tychonema sp. LEGE 07196]